MEAVATQIPRVPKRHMIEVLEPDRADKWLDERVGHPHIWNGLNLLDIEDAKIGLSAIEFK